MGRFSKARKRLRASARNALELVRLGRFGAPYSAPYDVVDDGDHHKLRRYANACAQDAPVALLIPPLMVTAEVYDVAPEVSAVTALAERGVRPFVVDFGAPERVAGGMKRTLDDHVRAVVRCIERTRDLTGRDVHVCGYSQGGMFAYQAAAYLRSAGIRSVVTFGSPVDVHRNLPAVRADVAGALVRWVEPAFLRVMRGIEGLPGVLTSTAFKLVSPRKELQQRVEFLRLLSDRGALVRREARRRFLGGEGFVAWPGPAFRAFVEDFIVANRLLSGGFVIDGRAVTLADVTCPILAFYGATDDIARPATVRPIAAAAPAAECSFVSVPAGHFGIVVGSRAMRLTWPTVAAWVLWREGRGPAPGALDEHSQDDEPQIDDELEPDLDVDIDLFFDTVRHAAGSAWRRLGDLAEGASDVVDAVRWQEPRLRRLASLCADTLVGPGRALAEQAARAPDATFFLWQGRAFSYRDADTRVTNVARGLWSRGVRPGDAVGVVMGSRPSFLTIVTALSRIGAVSVIAPPDAGPGDLRAAFERANVRAVASDPERAVPVRAALGCEVLVLGGGDERRSLEPGLVDMEALDVAHARLPGAFEPDAGRARDLAMVLLRPSEGGGLRAANVTNHRWALSALGAAAACTLKPRDTVYCCIPLHHPTGVLASVGAALSSGARLALGEPFEPRRFLAEVRRYGATVAFYAGEMLRALLFEAPGRGDRSLPLRLLAGSGMRRELAERLRERFGVTAMEFYAGTAQRVILASASGDKPGALGRPLPGSNPIAILACDLARREILRDPNGLAVPALRGEPGLLCACQSEQDAGPVVRDVLTHGDRWFVSTDVVMRDEDGDVWFVDALGGYATTAAGPVSTRKIEDALYALPEVRLAAAWGVRGAVVAAVVTDQAALAPRIEEALSRLEPNHRPECVLRLPSMPLTDGFRPKRAELGRLAMGAPILWRAR